MSADELPVQTLIDDLKHDETSVRLNSIKRLKTIAKALGAERTRQELVPFLTDSLDDEDEVLGALADEFGGMVELVGGGEHAACLLKPLAMLATVEELLVRDKCVASLRKVIDALPAGQFKQEVPPLVQQLALGEWFTGRVSAAALFDLVYVRSEPPTQAAQRQLFGKLCVDDTPMVRRAAASNLGKFASVLSKEHVKSDVMPLFLALAKDEQDSVRLLAVDNCVQITKALGGAAAAPADREPVLAATLTCARDLSWRVRYAVAERFCALCEAMGKDVASKDLLPAYVKLLKDAEPEVRTSAADKVAGVCDLVGKEQAIADVLPCVKQLVGDSSQHVRAHLASSVVLLAGTFGKEKTTEHLLELYLKLLQDEFSEVRLNVISKIDVVNGVIGVQLLTSSLLPAIVTLAEDKNWRVRGAIIKHVPLLAKQLGPQLFDEQLSNLCMTWLGDPIWSIRQAAAANLYQLARVFGVQWTCANIIPKVLMLYAHPNYLYRMTTLAAIAGLAGVVGVDVTLQSMLPLVVRMAGDSVPNCRYATCRALKELVPLVGPQNAAKLIKPCLQQLQADPDRDVQNMAREGMALFAA